MLVSLAVLALLVAMVTQLMNSATATTANSRRHMDADSQARMIFDRMGNDFANMVKRNDVDCIFFKNIPSGTSGVNDAFFFYSEAPAYHDSAPAGSQVNPVALVGYRINVNDSQYPGIPVLERMGKGLTLDGQTNNSAGSPAPGGMVYLTTQSGSAVPTRASYLDGNWTAIGTAAANYADGTDPDYHILSPEVCRLEIAFLLKDGTISTMPVIDPVASPAGASVSGTNGVNYLSASGPPGVNSDSANDDGAGNFNVGSRWFDTSAGGRGYVCTNATPGAAVWNPIGLLDISAVIVGIAILDTGNRNLVSPGGYAALIKTLADMPANRSIASSQLMAPVWLAAVNSTGFAYSAGIPQIAASQVRIYQRYFYLNN